MYKRQAYLLLREFLAGDGTVLGMIRAIDATVHAIVGKVKRGKHHNAVAMLVADQLYERYQYQRTALARQFPFMMGNNVWKGGGELNPNEQVGDALRSGTLGIGFIGGHNAMVALYGQGHGHNQKAWDTLYEAVMEMNKVVNEYKEKYNLNYSVLATPAEGLSGRFTKMDRRKYGKIPGVTDRDYYVNSFHVDVKERCV